jgi:hypothetical protein
MKDNTFGLPVYNEETSIEKLLEGIDENFPELKINTKLIHFKISNEYTNALKRESTSHILENGINYSNFELNFKTTIRIHNNNSKITENFLNYNKHLDPSKLNNIANSWKISKTSPIYEFIRPTTFSNGCNLIKGFDA